MTIGLTVLAVDHVPDHPSGLPWAVMLGSRAGDVCWEGAGATRGEALDDALGCFVACTGHAGGVTVVWGPAAAACHGRRTTGTGREDRPPA